MKAQWRNNGRDRGRKLLIAAGGEAISRVTVAYWTAVQESLNATSNPRPYRVPTPAPKGGPPAKRTGFLAGNVLYWIDRDQMRGRVGLTRNAIYGVYLEFRNHPWLSWTLERVKPQLAAIVKAVRGRS